MIVGILAGGKAKRFGGDKLHHPVGDKPLIDIVYDKVSSLGYPVYIITSEDRAESFMKRGYHTLIDSYLIGPIGGVITALQRDSALIVAGDMPFLDRGFLKKLIHISGRGRYTVIPTHSVCLLEPLHAVYSKCILGELISYVDSGGRGLQWFFKHRKHLYVPYYVKNGKQMRSFYNINTKEDLHALSCEEIYSR